MSDLTRYIVMHRHQYGTDIRVFESPQDNLEDIFRNLPDNDVLAEDEADDQSLTKEDFARRLDLNYEADMDEEIEIQTLDFDNMDTMDFSDFE